MTDFANVDLMRSIFAATERGDFSSAQWGEMDNERRAGALLKTGG